jgi:hypothetical protein
MGVWKMADRFKSELDTLARNEGANHQNDETIHRKAELLSLRRTRSKMITVDAIRNKLTEPLVFVSFIKIGVRADQSLASKVAVFGFSRYCRPIPILRDEHVGWS